MFAMLVVALPLWRHRVLVHRPPEPVFFEFHDLVLYTNDLFLIGALSFWLMSRRLNESSLPLARGLRLLVTPMVGLLCLTLLGAVWSVDPAAAAYQALRLVLLLGLFLAVAEGAAAEGMVVGALALGIALQGGVAALQFALGRSLGLSALGELTLNPEWPGASVVFAADRRWLRGYGLTQHPNLLGGYLVAGTLMVAAHLLERSRSRAPLLVSVAIGLVGLLATFSRSAWLGLVVGGGVAGALLWSWLRRNPAGWRRAASIIGLGFGIGLLFALAAWPLISSRLRPAGAGTEIRSVEERGTLVAGALRLIEARPWLGVGSGNFATALFLLVPESVADYPTYQPVHNVPLLAAAELGVGGALLAIAVMAVPWVLLWSRRSTMSISPWLAGTSGALAALTLIGLFDAYPWASHQGRLLLWFTLGLWTQAWKAATDTGAGGIAWSI